MPAHDKISLNRTSAECTQSAYGAMLDQDCVIGDYTVTSEITAQDREKIVETLIALHDAKGYKVSTFYCAVGLCDRYLRRRADSERKYHNATISTFFLLLAAKLEQPITPSFDMMILALP
jgi:glycine cleavage system regulatory protein